MGETLYVRAKNMNEWEAICKAYADYKKAKLLYVNNTSCGLEYPDGTFSHVYVDEMVTDLKNILEEEK